MRPKLLQNEFGTFVCGACGKETTFIWGAKNADMVKCACGEDNMLPPRTDDELTEYLMIALILASAALRVAETHPASIAKNRAAIEAIMDTAQIYLCKVNNERLEE